ncbi:MAG TPA: GAF domain-containing protein [Solirubrobacteraceae bacterium]|nr:GAF domain-containing protein [Solirubrobacteraceae bacterium]
MPMRATTVRFGDDLWALLEREAAAQGVSSAQFVRDAAILRLAHLASERGEPEARLSIERIAAGALREERSAGADGDVVVALREPARLTAVKGLTSGPHRPALDRLADVASRVLAAPVGLVTLVDADRQMFAGCIGVDKEPWATDRGTPISHSFCQHAIAAREPLVVSDAREHPVLKTNPAIRDLDVIAYLGVPLITADGHALGTLCVIDHKPRVWTSEQVRILEDLAASVVTELRVAADAA